MLLFGFATLATFITTSNSAPVDTCVVNNVTYQNGDTFTMAGFSRCIVYQCLNGAVSVYSDGCDADGACQAVGGTWVVDCRTYICSKTVQSGTTMYSTSVLGSQCADASGVCHNPGDVFSYVINGQTYSSCGCTINETGTIQYSCSGPCVVNNVTYQNGDIFTPAGSSNCLKYICNNGQASIYQEGCYADGACRPVDSTWTVNCRTKKCSKTVANNVSTYSTSTISSQCADASGVCHNPGDVFSYVINGQTYSSCGCTVSPTGTIQYSCSGPCVVNNITYQNGDIFTMGNSVCLKYICNNGQASIYQEGCDADGACRPVDSTWTVKCRTYKCSKSVANNISTYSTSTFSSQCTDANGVCRNPGDTFPLVIGSTTYQKCSCSIDANGIIQYSCTG